MAPNDVAVLLDSALKGVQAYWSSVLAALTGVGVLTMAVIQSVKDVFNLGALYNRQFLRSWIRKRKVAEVDEVEKGIIRLATDGNPHAFYGLKSEQITGQMNAAAQVVIAYPQKYPDLLNCLAQEADEADRKLLIQYGEKLAQAAGGKAPASLEKDKTHFIDARNRVAQQVQRAMDGLQIDLSDWWERWHLIASIALSSAFIWGALAFFGIDQKSGDPWHILLYLVIGVVGGFLAPVSKDLLSGLQKIGTSSK